MLRIKNQVLIFTLLFSQIVFGQPELNRVVQPSPEASALIKQMDIGNNYYTGAVQYTLPLYEIKGDLLSHSISASYASNGFTVQEEASRLGWNLNIGGEITRQVREIADETKYLEVIPDDTGDNAGEVNVHGGYFHNGCKNDERCDIPDIFHYSLPNGLSGKFTINQNMSTNQIPYNNVDISFDIGSINPTTLIDKNFIPSFTIKTKEGIIYKFDNYVLQKVLTINSWNN